jgi:thiamine-phosphate pyrophosphorylase
MAEVEQTMTDVSRETLLSEHEHYLNLLRSEPGSVGSSAFPRVDKQELSLYPVVDSVAWIKRLLELGVRTVQLRIKDADSPTLEQDILTAIQLGREYNAQLFINDYWQLAVKHQAYGVHLGQEDLDTASLEQIRSAGLRLGVSTHGYTEMLRAARIKPSYIALGHVFATPTKQMASEPQGLKRLAMYQRWVNTASKELNTALPTVAIGGIDLSNTPDVLQCGVDSVAVVRAVTQAANTREAINRFRACLGLTAPEQQGEGYACAK